MPMDDKGMYDWDGESRKYQTVVKYSCPKQGWGYPSNGASEVYSICQADKSWNVTFVEECICKSFFFIKKMVFESYQFTVVHFE